ncbi:MAG: 3-deoxy-7-phosphoheptulonate synthase [Chloroflexi bacterium]|nr:3-deoxy-7-phosphoheptulonate synthase [Chloroflexota bacterium]
MMIVMKANATKEDIQAVISRVKDSGLQAHLSQGVERTVIGVVGDIRKIQTDQMLRQNGVDRLVPISRPYKLASREFRVEDTIFPVNGMSIGDGKVLVIAGPCSVEDRGQLLETAHAVREAGANMLRGGAYKPRTSPYSFQGMGEEGLELLAEAREVTGLPIVTEVMEPDKVELVSRYADVLQVGARNMQNYALLHAVGKSNRPVLLKRGISATIDELLMAAEYILSHNNQKIMLCERGIRTFESSTRNTTDINAIPVLKNQTHLPVILDPSHSTGHWEYVAAIARAGVAAGADGLMIEVHAHPNEALSDGAQSLKPERFAELMDQIRAICDAVQRPLLRSPEPLINPASRPGS